MIPQIILSAVQAIFYVLNLNLTVQEILNGEIHIKRQSLFYIPYIVLTIIMCIYRNEIYLYLFSTLLFYTLLFLMITISAKISRKKALYSCLLFLSIDSVCQSVGYLSVYLFLDEFNRIMIFKLSSVLFNLITFLLLRTVISQNKNQVRNSIQLLSGKVYFMILISTVTVGLLCGNMASKSRELFFGNKINSTLTAVISLFFIAVMIFLVLNNLSKGYYESVSKIMEKHISTQIEYYKKINRLTDELREFRHDYKNHMICLQSLLECQQYEDALDYVRGITRQEIIEAHKLSTGNQIADAILSDKAEKIKPNGIIIQFDGFISDEIPAVCLCTILSNALDNAIEACEKIKTEDTSKEIKIKCAFTQGVQIIRISNPSDTVLSDMETTKKDKANHGFGLYNIRRTAETMGGQIKIPSQSPVWVLEVELPLNKS